MARSRLSVLNHLRGSRVIGYLRRRAIFFIPQLIGITFVTFVLVRLLPGDPATRLLGSLATPEQTAELREKLGLNDPVWEQYFNWMGDVLGGDLGISFFTSQPVIDDIVDRFPATLELITITLIISLAVMIPLGILAGRQTGGRLSRIADRTVFGYGLLAGALPDFWLGLILLFVFYNLLGLAPAPLGRLDTGVDPPQAVIGFYTFDSLVTGNWEAFVSSVRHLALPVTTLVFIYGGPILKMTRQVMSSVLNASYIEHGRTLGLQDRTVILYALRNSLPPVVTITGVVFGYLLGGAVLVETVFSWGGLGQYSVQSVLNADFTAIQGFVLLAAVFSIFVYLLVDIAYLIIDPRIGT
jgi:peptide/nickel transport system permease protein